VPSTFVTTEVGSATARAGRPTNADSVATHRYPDDHGTVAVAVVDGTGSTPEAVTAAYLAAEVAARFGARYGAHRGVTAASAMLANPSQDFPSPDGVIALAVATPGQPTRIAAVGDCVIYGVNGIDVRRLTAPHTHGQRLRAAGQPDDVARNHDHEVYLSVGRATEDTVTVTDTTDAVLALLSDGITAALNHDQIAKVLRANTTDADACANALVNAAVHARPKGDNVTAAVIVIPASPTSHPLPDSATP